MRRPGKSTHQKMIHKNIGNFIAAIFFDVSAVDTAMQASIASLEFENEKVRKALITLVGLFVLLFNFEPRVLALNSDETRSGNTIRLNQPLTTARTADETMRLILQRVAQRQAALKTIDKFVFLTGAEVPGLALPIKSLRTFSIQQFSNEFGNLRMADQSSQHEAESMTAGGGMSRGLVIYDLNCCLLPKNGMVAYSLKMAIADYDAAEDYMASWDLPTVWQSGNLGITTQKSLLNDIKKEIIRLTAKAAADFKESAANGLHTKKR